MGWLKPRKSTDRPTRPAIRYQLLVLGLGAFIGGASLLALALAIPGIGEPVIASIEGSYGILVDETGQELSPADTEALTRLITGGTVLTAQNLLAQTADYYRGIIRLLLVAFTFLGIIAFMSVRAISEDKAEEAAKNTVFTYFEKTSFNTILDNKVDRHSSELRESITDELERLADRRERLEKRLAQVKRLRKKIDDQSNRLEAVENRLAEFDSDEVEDSGGGSIELK